MKKTMYLLILSIFLLSVYTNESFGAYVCVDPSGSGDYTDIQSALDYADSSGESDVIQVVQGIYYGNFSYTSSQGYDITLYGGYTAGCANRIVDPSNTILDGNKTDRVLFFNDYGGAHTTIDGFTIQNGSSFGYGAGLSLSSDVSPGTAGDITVTNNNIIDNTATGQYGGGIYVNSQSNAGTAGVVTITNNKVLRNSAQTYAGVYARSFSTTGASSDIIFNGNTVSYNMATDSGGGAYIYTEADGNSGNITFNNNTFSGNTAENNYGALRIATDTNTGTPGNIIFVNNTVTNNVTDYYAGASILSMAGSGSAGTVNITNNTISANTSNTRTGGLYVAMDNNTNNVYNNIIWGNTAPERGDIDLTGTGTANGFNNDYTVMSGSWTIGGSNINIDPDFIDPDNGDYRLRSTSSCKDIGNNSAPSIPSDDFEEDTRPIDTTVDMGADEVSVITTCVSNATELQNALTSAQSNGKGDVIMVQKGLYSRTGNFSSIPSNSVELLGGFTPSCAMRSINPGSTVLNGDGSGSVLSITSSSSGDITIDGFTVQNGTATVDGGGLAAQAYNSSGPSGNLTIKNNIVKNNTAGADAGGISAYSYNLAGYNAGNITLINNFVTNNTATNGGGGANLMSFTTAGGAAGKITYTNNTFADNHANQGGGVRFFLSGATGGIVNSFNSIIWANTATSSSADVHLVKGSGISLGFNNDAEDVGGDSWDFSINNMGETPMFTSGYRLKPNSPCIDSGINAAAYLPYSDIDGNNRIIDGNSDGISTVDMGAFEYTPKGALSFLMLLLN